MFPQVSPSSGFVACQDDGNAQSSLAKLSIFTFDCGPCFSDNLQHYHWSKQQKNLILIFIPFAVLDG